jgi:uncharacterized membrane protein
MEASVVIDRPIDEVFAYVMEVGNWPRWHSGMLEGRQTSEGPVGVGTTFQGVNQFLGQRMEWTSEVTEYEPNGKLAQKLVAGPMSVEQRLTFETAEGGTRFTLMGEGETGGFFKLAEPLVNRRMQGQLDGDLSKLKDILESQS